MDEKVANKSSIDSNVWKTNQVKKKSLLLSFLTLLGVGCSGKTVIVPLSPQPYDPTELTLVWVGRGESMIYLNGTWKRTPESDYDFTVVQRRYHNHWVSVKTAHRRHPNYNGKAGPRDQVMSFRVDFSSPSEKSSKKDQVLVQLDSNLGQGQGETDRQFRNTVLEFSAQGVSRFAPYNRYRITQHYQYEVGALEETVELFKQNEGSKTLFVQIHEKATLFAPHKFSTPPTSF
ncbi:MAG: hypothetical protein K1X29_03445 [Bdellovibrionales bacterium]|nr:hypothetical protein [Bdellovibrionales bacterium]